MAQVATRTRAAKHPDGLLARRQPGLGKIVNKTVN
jgi:hypothetical protein